jgi:hypothetical protein
VVPVSDEDALDGLWPILLAVGTAIAVVVLWVVWGIGLAVALHLRRQDVPRGEAAGAGLAFGLAFACVAWMAVRWAWPSTVAWWIVGGALVVATVAPVVEGAASTRAAQVRRRPRGPWAPPDPRPSR